MGSCIGTGVYRVPEEFQSFFGDACPMWTRLEPVSVSGDPGPGVEARVHDAAWLLARQWQLGEFAGEDVGSPLTVSASWTTTPVTGWRSHAAGPDDPLRAFEADDLLDPWIEGERGVPVGLRQRFEAGSLFLAMMTDAGVADLAPIREACRHPAEAPDAADPDAATRQELTTLFGDAIPDGDHVATRLRGGAAPDWLPHTARAAAGEWLAWYDGAAHDVSGSWVPERLEYSMDLEAGPYRFEVNGFAGGRLDWFDIDVKGKADAAPVVSRADRSAPVWATPLRFTGMPNNRYWQFEDAAVDLGAIAARPHDLGRLALAEFALVSGHDWLVVPLDIPWGSVTVIDELTYTTTFGDRITVPRASRQDRFQMFEVPNLGSVSPESSSSTGLFLPPSAPVVQLGPPLEEVLYLRDEGANLAWAIEQVVTGPSGDPRRRADEPPPAPPPPGSDPRAAWDYIVQTSVAGHWFPYVPVTGANSEPILRRGSLANTSARPVGVMLADPNADILHDEEVPRSGVAVRRIPALARRADGEYVRWIARRAAVSLGEARSELHFDAALSRTRAGDPAP